MFCFNWWILYHFFLLKIWLKIKKNIELGHGSDVRGIETTATYDHSTKEFIIKTPSDFAQKYFIGGGIGNFYYTFPLTFF